MKKTKFLALLLVLAMMVGLLGISASATVPTYDSIEIQFGDPNYPSTWPENMMSLSLTDSTTHTYTALFNNDANSTYYPSILSLYAFYSTNTNLTLTSNDTSKIKFVTYDQDGTEIIDPDGVMNYTQNLNWNADANNGAGGMVSSNLYAVKILDAGSITISSTNNTKYVTINFQAPQSASSSAGTTPKAVKSYLPIGQYATGAGWGNASGKFVNSFNSTGVSLGALGGYIEFDFDDPSTTTVVEGITNDPRNPYGVDFVVYGNAFGGNPEAGAVQVGWEHNNTVTWYELAGSMYYDTPAASATAANVWHNGYTGTLRNADVTYTLNSSNIYASMTDGTTTISASPFSSNINWWPTKTEGNNAYADSVIAAAHQDSNVTIARSGDTTGSTLVFGGVTAIPDSNTTADYAFGYADVTPNGTITNYGDAVNPYTPYTSSKTGGDGFDLEWAVNIATGEPVDVSGKTFRYVRVYSAVLDNWTFGETSTEICGIYTAYRTTTEEALDEETGVDRTAKPGIRFGAGTSTSALSFSNSGAVVEKTIAAGDTNTIFTVKVNASTADNIYINNTRATSGTGYTFAVPAAGKTKTIRFVVQTGDAAPYIVTLKVTKAASK